MVVKLSGGRRGEERREEGEDVVAVTCVENMQGGEEKRGDEEGGGRFDAAGASLLTNWPEIFWRRGGQTFNPLPSIQSGQFERGHTSPLLSSLSIAR